MKSSSSKHSRVTKLYNKRMKTVEQLADIYGPSKGHMSYYGTEEEYEEFEDVKHRIARWRWTHDEAWLRLVTRYVELRQKLHKSNELLILGSQMEVGYYFSELGVGVVRNWLCQELPVDLL